MKTANGTPDTLHYVTCAIELGGDNRMIVHRGADNPVAWTEIPVLQAIHGETSIFDVNFSHSAPRETTYNEKRRLTAIYGTSVVEAVYPGNRPNFEWHFPGAEEPLADPAPAEKPRKAKAVETDEEGYIKPRA